MKMKTTPHPIKNEFQSKICKQIVSMSRKFVYEGMKPFKCDACDYNCYRRFAWKLMSHQFMKERKLLNVTFVTAL